MEVPVLLYRVKIEVSSCTVKEAYLRVLVGFEIRQPRTEPQLGQAMLGQNVPPVLHLTMVDTLRRA